MNGIRMRLKKYYVVLGFKVWDMKLTRSHMQAGANTNKKIFERNMLYPPVVRTCCFMLSDSVISSADVGAKLVNSPRLFKSC